LLETNFRNQIQKCKKTKIRNADTIVVTAMEAKRHVKQTALLAHLLPPDHPNRSFELSLIENGQSTMNSQKLEVIISNNSYVVENIAIADDKLSCNISIPINLPKPQAQWLNKNDFDSLKEQNLQNEIKSKIDSLKKEIQEAYQGFNLSIEQKSESLVSEDQETGLLNYNLVLSVVVSKPKIIYETLFDRAIYESE
jgi:hypothetical protein